MPGLPVFRFGIAAGGAYLALYTSWSLVEIGLEGVRRKVLGRQQYAGSVVKREKDFTPLEVLMFSAFIGQGFLLVCLVED